ncbi:MAG: HNH endonuclease [Gemmatimonadaceae bacterium]|nr:HNH endonuclease [Gemmatimonadaceae bacterium]
MPSRSNPKPAAHPKPAAAAHAAAKKAPAAKRSRSRRGRGGGGGAASQESALSSMPTGRAAYAETRRWLVARHGNTCAYCARKVRAQEITLDHVAPRRGMTAYDRRDNLVLCCLACNIAKADKTTMAWLLAKRNRAVQLIRFGGHLSEGLVEMARDLAGPEGVALAERLSDPDYPYSD